MSFTEVEKKARWMIALDLREKENKTFAQIGEILECSAVRARDLYNIGLRKRKRSEEWYHPLSVRAVNILCNAGINSKKEALKAFEAGRFGRNGRYTLRNYGKKTHREICRWIGIPGPDDHLKNAQDALRSAQVLVQRWQAKITQRNNVIWSERDKGRGEQLVICLTELKTAIQIEL